MRFSIVLTMLRKELLDTVRDRRTLISMVVVPVLSMPLLFFVVEKFRSTAEKKAGEESVAIAVRGAENVPGTLNALAAERFKLFMDVDPKKGVESEKVAAGVEIAPGNPPQVRIYSYSTREASGMAAGRIRKALDSLRDDTVRRDLRSRGLPESVLTPFKVERVDLAGEKKIAALLWGSMLGYIVVLLMFTGGMYPAIDVTAGEKERRTLEVLLSAPAGRNELVLGKILATTVAIFVTALLTIGSVVVSVRQMGFDKAPEMKAAMGNMPLDARTLGLVLISLLPMAVMAASVMIAVALAAKSFKEAQSYLTPVMLAAMFPLIVGMMPGIKLTPALAMVPVFNVCQLIKEIFLGEFTAVGFGATLAANLVYAAVAFYAAVRMFNNERVLFRT